MTLFCFQSLLTVTDPRVLAVAFGYFETLAKLNDVNKFSEEEARLRSLSNVLNAAGYEPYLYEDFAEETFELLRNVRSAMQAGNVETALLDAFNNEYLQNNIITHLRVPFPRTIVTSKRS